MKKIMKIAGVILLLIIIVLAVIVVWNWDVINVFRANADPESSSAAVPKAAAPEITDITTGKHDWPGWMGASYDGRSGMTNIPTDWSTGLKKEWEINFLCQGKASAVWSAPAVQGNRLVVCGRDEANDLVFCLNPETGALIWKTSYPARAGTNFGMGSRATPRIDDDRVYTFGRNGDLVCWQLKDGTKVWHKNVNDEGGKEPTWGHSTSPLITDKLIIVGAGGTALTIAYDKQTGETAWKTGTGTAGYAAIYPAKLEDKPGILVFHGKGLAALDPGDGTALWDIEWITNYDVNATTPIMAGDLVFISSGYGTGGEVLKVSRSEAEVVWKNEIIASHHSDPFIIDGHIYGYSGMSMQNRGAFKCVDLATGAEKWSTNEMGWGTCVLVAGHLLCMDIKGNLFLMKPDPAAFKLVTHMPGALGKTKGAAWTIPVLANGKLYLRFKEKLLCYSFSDKEQKPEDNQ